MVGRNDRSAREKQVVALFLSSADACASIARECRAFTVRTHQSVRDLLATVRQADVTIVVMDAVDARGRSHAPAVQTLRALQPDLPILGYCTVSPMVSAAIPDFIRCGATGLLFRGIDDTGIALRAALRSASRSVVEARIYQAIAPLVSDAVRLLLRYALAVSDDDVSVTDAAHSLGVDRKTLLNRLRDLGDIGPREFINWIRIAIGIGLLEQGGRSAEQVALAVGFASGTAFRNMVKRYTGRRPAELCDHGGLAAVLLLFARRFDSRGGSLSLTEDGNPPDSNEAPFPQSRRASH